MSPLLRFGGSRSCLRRRKVRGFLTARIRWALQWDHIYSADYFLLLLALLGASLAACTVTNQWPAVKVARRWRFKGDQDSLARLPVASLLPNARLADVGRALLAKNYQVGEAVVSQSVVHSVSQSGACDRCG